MRPFECRCGARVFFENTVCLSCGSALGFLPDRGELRAIEALATNEHLLRPHLDVDSTYRRCANYGNGICNWMVRAEDTEARCQACRLNHVIPDLSRPDNLEKWARVESAKRRLVYTLNRLALPIVSKGSDPEHGLSFDIKEDTPSAHVLTGHSDGLITLRLAEADPLLREKSRISMNERYRTLLGHFRHEIGHYYWDVLIRDRERLDAFRELFGDEQQNYWQALQRHYDRADDGAWKGTYVSFYATAHPWEDWAETWAHYLHMFDTLETANAHGLSGTDFMGSSPNAPFATLISDWLALTVILNALSRSMGQEDLYPFEIGDGARAKLAFVHDVVASPPASDLRLPP